MRCYVIHYNRQIHNTQDRKNEGLKRPIEHINQIESGRTNRSNGVPQVGEYSDYNFADGDI
jgi:hypothetical protein